MTPDGKYAYVTDGTGGVTGGVFRKVDLATGAVTPVPAADSAGTWDVVVVGDGIAIADGRSNWSSWVPLYTLQATTRVRR